MFLAWVKGGEQRELAGCVALRRHDEQSAEMKRLYLRPAYQGQGLGRQLAEHIIAQAKLCGYQRLLLDTLPIILDSAVDRLFIRIDDDHGLLFSYSSGSPLG